MCRRPFRANPCCLQLAYARELFDYYAPTYDDHLRKKLLYTGPRLLRQVTMLSAVPTLPHASCGGECKPTDVSLFSRRCLSCVGDPSPLSRFSEWRVLFLNYYLGRVTSSCLRVYCQHGRMYEWSDLVRVCCRRVLPTSAHHPRVLGDWANLSLASFHFSTGPCSLYLVALPVYFERSELLGTAGDPPENLKPDLGAVQPKISKKKLCLPPAQKVDDGYLLLLFSH